MYSVTHNTDTQTSFSHAYKRVCLCIYLEREIERERQTDRQTEVYGQADKYPDYTIISI